MWKVSGQIRRIPLCSICRKGYCWLLKGQHPEMDCGLVAKFAILPASSRACAGPWRLFSIFWGSFKNQTEDLCSRTWPLSLCSSFSPTLLWCPLPPIHLFLKRLCHCVHQYAHGLSCFSLGLKVQSKSVYGFGELILPHPSFLNRLFLYQACRACRMYWSNGKNMLCVNLPFL